MFCRFVFQSFIRQAWCHEVFNKRSRGCPGGLVVKPDPVWNETSSKDVSHVAPFPVSYKGKYPWYCLRCRSRSCIWYGFNLLPRLTSCGHFPLETRVAGCSGWSWLHQPTCPRVVHTGRVSWASTWAFKSNGTWHIRNKGNCVLSLNY